MGQGWRFNLASHGGGDYIREQTVMESADNMPGAAFVSRRVIMIPFDRSYG